MQEVSIMILTKARGPERVKAAGFKYIMNCAGAKITGSGRVEDTTGNRVVLIALIEALKRMKKLSLITVWTESNYLIQSQGQLDQWKQNGWRRTNGAPVKNADLWEELRQLQKGQAIRYRYENLDMYK